jgi:hypothetical protein
MTKLRTVPFVDMPSFQFGLANVKAGRSGYQDLADALSQINPALQQFGRISLAKQQLIEQKQEEDRLAREAEIAKGREAFQLDPSGVSEQLKNLTRKGINAGVIPENANAPFIIGGLQAQGEVLVNRDYRGQLRSLVETTNDPEVAIAQTKAEFLKRPEFSDPSVRAYAAEVFGKVDDEFRRDVNNRLDSVRTEKSKGAWLELGLPLVDGVVKGDIDINSPEMVGWVNRAAGVFKGSHKYAFDELIKPSILELVEAGGSAIALDKVQEIENWVINPNTGAKFITAELRDDIATFKRDIEAKDAYFKNKTKNLYTTNKEKVLNPLVTEFKGKLNDGDIITDSYLKDWTNRVREAGSTSGVFGLDIEETIGSMIELSNKDYYNADTGDVETNTSVWTALQADLDKGIDVLPDAQDALERGDLTWDDFKDIQKRNGDSDRFNKEIMEGVAAIKRATESFGNQFKDTTLTEEMRIRGITPPTTNFVKNITGLNAHPNTLDTLKLRGLLSWSRKVKETRDNILKANPNTTPQQLDEALTDQSLELYESFNEEYRETVLSQLRTGKYIIDNDQTITVKMLDKAITGIETGNPSLVDLKIEDLVLKLEFSDNLEERLQFLRTYKNKIK